MLRDLNAQLAGLASERGLGFADAFTATLPLLAPDPFPVFGVPFANSGSETGDLAFSWLDGELSYNFHPNTNVQALLANEIIHAFNRALRCWDRSAVHYRSLGQPVRDTAGFDRYAVLVLGQRLRATRHRPG